MAAVSVRAVHKHFGSTHVIRGVDIGIADGEFCVLVGPSGCGKSTLLRMIAGLEEITEGEVAIGGTVVNRVPPKERDIAMVFQNYALYPHMTVRANMSFALDLAKRPKAEIEQQVKRAADILGLVPYLDRYPRQLSGGQRQRVAMGRAIVRQPRVFLMDEPLSNLDAKLRVQTRTQIAALQRRLGVTTVYVTHDQVEAMTMGDRVAVLKDGVLQQCAPPRELFSRPVNVFVAGFIGSPAMNLLPATVSGSSASIGALRIDLSPAQQQALTSDRMIVGVRPEAWVLSDHDGLAATVEMVEELGSDSFLYCTTTLDDVPSSITVRREGLSGYRAGDVIALRPDPAAVHLFDTATGDRLPS